jgi:hypothetical protein
MLSVEMGTPDGQLMSQFLQLEQRSAARSGAKAGLRNRDSAGPTILGPRNSRVAAATGHTTVHDVQAMHRSES